MSTNFLRNSINRVLESTYSLALNTTEKGATDDCAFFLWYEPEFIEEMMERE